MRFGQEYRLDNTTSPTVVLRSSNGDRFFLREDITIKNIKRFYNNWKSDGLKKFQLSQPVFEEPEGTLVYNLVGSDFQERIDE